MEDGHKGGKVSRRRLLKLAAYSVPALSALNVAGAARAAAASLPEPPGGCDLPVGAGLLGDLYDNPWWRNPYWQCCVVEAPCHPHPWYPIAGMYPDHTFSARWAGNLIVRVPGTYQLRVRGKDFVAGSLGIVAPNPSYVTFGPDGVTVDLECGEHLLDIVFSHWTGPAETAQSWVCLEWIPPGGGDWQPVPATELYEMW